MEFDISWILLGFPAAFVLGWLASRFDLRQIRRENRSAPKAYFKGLNFLLNEQQDKAIDAFIEAVQNDPDTAELHFALGNLFRRRGEYSRAVRVHEHLLSRADIGKAERERAQHALALDFLKAGLLDRAEDALARLDGTPYENEARLSRLAIYERAHDWPQAVQIAQQIQSNGQGDYSVRIAHYLCEQALSQQAHGQLDAARKLLQDAQSEAPRAPRPRIELAHLQHKNGQSALALDTLLELAAVSPSSVPLVAALMVELAKTDERKREVRALLQANYNSSPSLDVMQSLVQMDELAMVPDATSPLGREWYVEHLRHEPSVVAAGRWLAQESLTHEEHHPAVQRALDNAAKPLTRYRCAACGFEARQHFWQCPGCQSWDSYPPRRVEEH
ncbi:MAG: lipopolysaccharide assembly protein LapB [Comamonas sp.]